MNLFVAIWSIATAIYNLSLFFFTMGAKQSLPDISTKRGGLTSADDTVDGSPPTSEFMKFTVYPTGGLVQWGKKKYAAEVRDASGSVMYRSEANAGIGAGFDLMNPDGELLVRVGSSQSKMNWIIYKVGAPTFAGQIKDEGASEKTGDDCYKRAYLTYDEDRTKASIAMFGPLPQDGSVRAAKESGVLGETKLEIKTIVGMGKEIFESIVPHKNKKSKKPPKIVGVWTWKKEKPVIGADFVAVDLCQNSDIVLHAVSIIISHVVAVDRRQGGAA